MGAILGRGILCVALESVMTSEFAPPVGAVSSVLLVRAWRGDSGAPKCRGRGNPGGGGCLVASALRIWAASALPCLESCEDIALNRRFFGVVIQEMTRLDGVCAIVHNVDEYHCSKLGCGD